MGPPRALTDVERGADVLVTRCLRLEAGERVHLLTWGAGDVADAIATAVERASCPVVRIPLEPLIEEAGTPKIETQLSALLAGATASVLVATDGLPGPLGYGVVGAAARAKSRHIHMPRADIRMLSQGVRADPEVLATLNERVMDLVRPPTRLYMNAPGGSELEVALAADYAMVSLSGRPARGSADNLPSGSVYTHPSAVEGTFVADRAVFASELHLSSSTLRRHPIRFTIRDGKVESFDTSDPAAAKAVEAHLASHPRAARVGLVTLPTNYLVRSEIGVATQDALMPGLNISLGFTASKFTHAPHDVPAQMLLVARKASVAAKNRPIVTDGRFEPDVIEGLDPFRS